MKALSLFVTCFLVQQLIIAQSSTLIETRWKQEEYVTPINNVFKLEVVDARKYHSEEVSLVEIMEHFNAAIQNNTDFVPLDDINDTGTILKPVILKTLINFFNFTESTEHNVFLKFFIDMELYGTETGQPYNKRIENDIMFSNKSLRSLMSPKNDAIRNKAVLDLIKKTVLQITEEINVLKKKKRVSIYEVVAFGKSKIIGNDTATSKNYAIKNSLLNASQKVFGKGISSETTMVDMGNVTETIKENIDATVLESKIFENHFVVTDDGYCCVLIKSILKNKL